ncbi:MAG: hypothetical protein R2781_02750 [Flavobacteriaceae bacterium]
MKKTIFLFLLLLGFTSLQAQKTNDTNLKLSTTVEGYTVPKNASKAAIFASRKTVANSPARITVNTPVCKNSGGGY